ncbi:MAG: hypothetical protein PHT54_03850 [Candidatus Nanoarchaeia archaeon]|nr:hypothetical protein [Candidatus Nanoarchaeia archaeon]
MLNKKGAEISLNTVIIAIIVIIVLVVVVVFFLFGFENVTTKIKSIFYSGTTGTDESLAVQLCNTYCSSITSISQAPNSAYCKKEFDILEPNTGKTIIKKCINLAPGCKVEGQPINC